MWSLLIEDRWRSGSSQAFGTGNESSDRGVYNSRGQPLILSWRSRINLTDRAWVGGGPMWEGLVSRVLGRS